MKSKEQYLSEYEDKLKQTSDYQHKLDHLNVQKQQFLNTVNVSTQIESINIEILDITAKLMELKNQSTQFTSELNQLSANDDSLKQKIFNLEKQYQTIQNTIHNYEEAFIDIMVLLNGFSANEGLNLNQTQVLTEILPPEELMHTDILKKACAMNHREEFDKAIDKITNINFQDKEGKTLLMHSINNGFYYGVDKLLKMGADVNIVDKKGANALINCAALPHISYIKIIAEKTVDIHHNVPSAIGIDGHEGGNALHFLIASGGNKVTFGSELNAELQGVPDQNSLLIADEDYVINTEWIGSIKTGNHSTTLTINANVSIGAVTQDIDANSFNPTSYKKTELIIQCLIDRGIDINAKTSGDSGVTPLWLAAQDGKVEILKLLADRGADLNIPRTDTGMTPLHIAMSQGQQTVVQELIDRGADINTIDLDGRNAFHHWKMVEKDEVLFNKLLSQGVSTDVHNKHGGYPLHCAVHNDSLPMIELLTPHSDINQKSADNNQFTPLWFAARDGKLPIIKYLLDHGANVNLTPVIGVSPLQVAISQKHNLAVKELLQNGADVNVIDSSGNNILLLSLAMGDTDIINSLLEKGLSVNDKNSAGITPIHWAVSNNEEAMVRFLLAKNANINVPDNTGVYPLHTSVLQGFGSLAKLITNYEPTDVNVKSSALHQITPLWLAAQNNDSELIQLLISRSADINAVREDTAMPPLHIAMQKKHLQVTKELITMGAKVDLVDTSGLTSLHWAVNLGDVSVAKIILAKNININARSNDGLTALYYSALQGMQDMVELLLANNADINIPNKSWYYPIHGAIHNGHLQVIKILFANNGDINQVTLNTNITPLYYSVGYSGQTVSLGIIDYLLNNGANANIPDNTGVYPWHFASFKGHLDVMKILISKIPAIDYKTSNTDKYTALWLASQQGHLEIVKWLISKQADVNAARESDGRTALQAAIYNENLSVVQELVEHGAEVNKSNYKQFTPLYHAVETENLSIIKFLIKHNADINKACFSGDQPIHMAAFLSNILIMKILFDHGASINATSNIGNTLLHEVLWEGSKADPADKLKATKYLLSKSVNPQTPNNEGKTAVDLAQANFQEALPWFEHPENLPSLQQLESELIGNFSYLD